MNASIGIQKKEHAVDTRVLCMGPKLAISGIRRAVVNISTTGPNLMSRLESLWIDPKSQRAPAAMSANVAKSEARSTLALCSAITLSG